MIKPCPFCGYDSPRSIMEKTGIHYVECVSCCAKSAETSSAAKSLEFWNKRHVTESADVWNDLSLLEKALLVQSEVDDENN